MKQAAILKKEELDNFPSLKEAIFASLEGYNSMDEMIEKLNNEIVEIENKIKIAEELGMKVQGYKSVKTRKLTKIEEAKKAKEAFKKGYFEIPNFGHGWNILEDPDHYSFAIPTNAPLRCFEALKKAKETGIFKRFEFIQDGGDPIIVARLAGRCFYITSYH